MAEIPSREPLNVPTKIEKNSGQPKKLEAISTQKSDNDIINDSIDSRSDLNDQDIENEALQQREKILKDKIKKQIEELFKKGNKSPVLMFKVKAEIKDAQNLPLLFEKLKFLSNGLNTTVKAETESINSVKEKNTDEKFYETLKSNLNDFYKAFGGEEGFKKSLGADYQKWYKEAEISIKKEKPELAKEENKEKLKKQIELSVLVNNKKEIIKRNPNKEKELRGLFAGLEQSARDLKIEYSSEKEFGPDLLIPTQKAVLNGFTGYKEGDLVTRKGPLVIFTEKDGTTQTFDTSKHPPVKYLDMGGMPLKSPVEYKDGTANEFRINELQLDIDKLEKIKSKKGPEITEKRIKRDTLKKTAIDRINRVKSGEHAIAERPITLDPIWHDAADMLNNGGELKDATPDDLKNQLLGLDNEISDFEENVEKKLVIEQEELESLITKNNGIIPDYQRENIKIDSILKLALGNFKENGLPFLGSNLENLKDYFNKNIPQTLGLTKPIDFTSIDGVDLFYKSLNTLFLKVLKIKEPLFVGSPLKINPDLKGEDGKNDNLSKMKNQFKLAGFIDKDGNFNLSQFQTIISEKIQAE